MSLGRRQIGVPFTSRRKPRPSAMRTYYQNAQFGKLVA